MAIVQYSDLINQAAKKHGIPANLIASVMKVESGGNPNAASGTGPVGLMQISKALAKDYGYSDADRLDPEKNIDMGARYLKANLDRFGGNTTKALLGYNQGTGGAAQMLSGKIPMAAEGRNYINNPTFRGLMGQGDVHQIANPIASLQEQTQIPDQFNQEMLNRSAALAAPTQAEVMASNAAPPVPQLTQEQQDDLDEQNKRDNYKDAALMALSMFANRQPKSTTTSFNTGVGGAGSNFGAQTQKVLGILSQLNR